MSGENLPLVGRLLGHRRHQTTAALRPPADGHLVDAAEKVGGIIVGAMVLHGASPPSIHAAFAVASEGMQAQGTALDNVKSG